MTEKQRRVVYANALHHVTEEGVQNMVEVTFDCPLIVIEFTREGGTLQNRTEDCWWAVCSEESFQVL